MEIDTNTEEHFTNSNKNLIQKDCKNETFQIKKLFTNNKLTQNLKQILLLVILFIFPLAQNSNLKSNKNSSEKEKEQESLRILQETTQSTLIQQQASSDQNTVTKTQDSYTSLQNYYEDYPQVGVYSLKVNNTNVINNIQFTTQTKFDFYDEQRKNSFSLDLTDNLIKFLGSFNTNSGDISQLNKNKDYLNYIKNSYKKRTILIGIDGMVNSCIDFKSLSAFKFLKENGSSSLRSRGTTEGLSGPGWSSVLCSLSSKDTGIVNNEWKAPWLSAEIKQNYKYFTPLNGLDKSFPCLFDELKTKKKAFTGSKANRNFTNFVYSSWSFFRDNLGNKAFPGSLDLYAECQIRTSQSYFEYINCDDYSLERSKNFLLQDFDLYFWYMGSLDVAGHTFSFCGSEYQSRVANVNNHLTNFFEFLKALGLLDKVNIIVTSDHGADRSMMSHGKDKYDGNLLVPLFFMGPDFKKNYEIKGPVNGLDIAPTIMRLNGLPYSELWSGKVIYEALAAYEGDAVNQQLVLQQPIVVSSSAGFVCGNFKSFFFFRFDCSFGFIWLLAAMFVFIF